MDSRTRANNGQISASPVSQNVVNTPRKSNMKASRRALSGTTATKTGPPSNKTAEILSPQNSPNAVSETANSLFASDEKQISNGSEGNSLSQHNHNTIHLNQILFH